MRLKSLVFRRLFRFSLLLLVVYLQSEILINYFFEYTERLSAEL